MARPDERRFVTFPRGHVRDNIILALLRNNLREKVNPDTQQVFTEDEIAIITQEGSRFFVEADAIDLYGQAIQQRAIWFADQVRPERAASSFLTDFHGDLWLPEGLLPSSGGSGPALGTGSVGTIYVGSTTLGDPTAAKARDAAGLRYQVLVTSVADINGQARLNMSAIDGGSRTNLKANTELTWINAPIGADPTFLTSEKFRGGFEAESNPEFAKRIKTRIRSKPGAGNSAQFRLWALQSSVAVEDAFIYPTAFHTGSVLVVIAQKRGSTKGPLARIASIGTLTAATGFLTPPASPVVPMDVYVLVTPMVAENTEIALKLSMPRGTGGGWSDVDPWPRYTAAYPQGVLITTVTSQTSILVTTNGVLENAPLSGAFAPQMAVWDNNNSEFITLDVNTVSLVGGDVWSITLNNPPSTNDSGPFTLAVGQAISPKNDRSNVVAESVQAYFDELGPSQAVDTTSTRFVRAARFPDPAQEYPIIAGQSVIARLDDQLGGALSAAELVNITKTQPTLPTDATLALGTPVLVLNRAAIYSFN